MRCGQISPRSLNLQTQVVPGPRYPRWHLQLRHPAGCPPNPVVLIWGHEGTPMKDWLLVLKAADAAARWHVHHRRKGPAEEPYINHLLEVAMLVAEATGASDTNLVIAALLHDAIEDAEVSRELISPPFADDVSSIVAQATHA